MAAVPTAGRRRRWRRTADCGIVCRTCCSGASTKRTCSEPQRMTSPWFSSSRLIRRSLINVPLAEPRSSTYQRALIKLYLAVLPRHHCVVGTNDAIDGSTQNEPVSGRFTAASRPWASRYRELGCHLRFFSKAKVGLQTENHLDVADADHVPNRELFLGYAVPVDEHPFVEPKSATS